MCSTDAVYGAGGGPFLPSPHHSRFGAARHLWLRRAARQPRLERTEIEAVRRGLSAPGPAGTPYSVRVHHSGVRPGIDVTALNRLADELEDDALVAGRDA